MTTNIYLAQLLGAERQQDLLEAAAARRRAVAARGPRPSWRDRLFHHEPDTRPASPTVTGDTWIAA
ncbi:MAG TPA: hypothetical protein VFK41_12505 [Nocardioidaceae bacterium]|nr:hypothetical protein [Nocardioidaceae bacterium]